jgi:hypothetical protein
MIEKNYTTSLELLNASVAAILDAKLAATSPQSVADYIAFSLDNLDANIDRAKQAKKELDEYIKHQQSVIDTIKQDSAKWLSDVGVDKLEGMRVSSVTTYQPSPEQKLVIHNKAYFEHLGLVKTSLDETKIKELLNESATDLSKYAEIKVTHKQPLLKVNGRKK